MIQENQNRLRILRRKQKVEMVCAEEYIKDVIAVLLENPSYETPAYYVHKISTDF